MTQPEQVSPLRAVVAVDWAAAADIPTLHVNQFAAQVGIPTRDGVPDGLDLLLGSIAPPLLFGKDAAAQQREIESLGSVSVIVHGRFHLSRARLDELIDVLQQAAGNYDTARKALQDALAAAGEHGD